MVWPSIARNPPLANEEENHPLMPNPMLENTRWKQARMLLGGLWNTPKRAYLEE